MTGGHRDSYPPSVQRHEASEVSEDLDDGSYGLMRSRMLSHLGVYSGDDGDGGEYVMEPESRIDSQPHPVGPNIFSFTTPHNHNYIVTMYPVGLDSEADDGAQP